MKKFIFKILWIIIFFIGISLIMYPYISEYWNSLRQTKAISNYENILDNLKEEDYEKITKKIKKYNKDLAKLNYPLIEYKKLSSYKKVLSIDKNGMLGYLKISKINVELPIYYGTSSKVLNTSVGLLEGSSVPIGGKNTHAVLSAHRGLPTSTLFTNLNELEIGDIFEINVLGEILTYQIDKITIVKPTDISNLKISKGKDYITLMTCTPYGLNTHRLLVRGVRIKNIEEKVVVVTNDAKLINKNKVSLFMTVPLFLISILYFLLKPSKKFIGGKIYE